MKTDGEKLAFALGSLLAIMHASVESRWDIAYNAYNQLCKDTEGKEEK
jgi:hypothetical protein